MPSSVSVRRSVSWPIPGGHAVSFVVDTGATLEGFLDFSGPTGALMVNNLDWLDDIRLIDWLRDVGKHFTMPYMLAMTESCWSRSRRRWSTRSSYVSTWP